MSRRACSIAAVCSLTIALGLGLLAPTSVSACPFCAAAQATLSEEIASTDVTVLCELAARPPNDDGPCTFRVVESLKGDEMLAEVLGPKQPHEFSVLYFGEEPLGTKFVAFGLKLVTIEWGLPTPLSDAGVAYLKRLPTLPTDAAQRLTFFLDYFEHDDKLLAADAFDEFSRASYTDLARLRDRLPREKLLAFINDPNVATTHRRQYLCLLSLCGRPEDVSWLEAQIRSDDPVPRAALDALIGCYLVLRGEAGMPWIEERFLKNRDADFNDTYATLAALRFIVQETHAVPHERVLESFRLMFDRPKLVDLIIPDLTRAQDWSAIPQAIALFKSIDRQGETLQTRVAIANYVRVCPLPEAKTALAEFEALDPAAMRHAAFYFGGAAEPPSGALRPKTTDAP